MQPGDVVDGRFRVQVEAGAGALGVVYRCDDLSSGGQVALKVLDRTAVRHKERFVREAELLASVVHPAVIRYIAHGLLDSGDPYLVMQWIDGEDLGQRLERTPLTLEESIAVAGRVSAALGAAHAKGIVHRDVKPGNILLPRGDPRLALLIDFGIARMGGTRMTLPGGVVGTPGYMAPEQARGDADVDARADVFSLGCVLFECLSGQAAFAGESAMAILAKVILEPAPSLDAARPGLPEGLGALVDRMLAKSREDRPANGSEVLRELEDAARGVVSRSVPPPAARSLTTREQRVLSIIVAKVGEAAKAGDTLVDSVSGSELRALAAGPPPSAHEGTLSTPASLEAVKRAASGLGSSIEVLLDGSLVMLVVGDHSATDQATRAARCALAIREVCEPGTRIVLATGRGEMAGQLPVGAVIDRAFELLDGPKAKGVRLDELTAQLAEGRFRIDRDDSGPVLLSDKTDDAPRLLLGKRTPCVGREGEVASFLALFEECCEERTPRIALMTGDAGIGKSRVRAEFVARVRERSPDTVILSGAGDPGRSGAAFGVLRHALRRYMQIDAADPVTAQRAKVLARVAACVEPEETHRIASLLAHVMGFSYEAEDEEPSSSARGNHVLMGDAMREAWQVFAAALAKSAPVVIILEDLHWGDRPSLDFVLGSAKALRDSRLFVLATARGEAKTAFADLFERQPMTQVALAPLTRRACERLAKDVLGEAPAALVDRLVAQSGGNAFLLEELLRARKEGRSEGVPESVLAMAQTRIDALPPLLRRAARAASVLGDDACDEGLTALLGSEETMAGDLAAELVRAEILVPRGSGSASYDFRHALVRDAAYATLTEEDRVLAHSLAARWLEKRPLANPVTIAKHFLAAAEPERAAGPWAVAATQALEGNDLAAALEYGERALECGASGELRGRIACLLAEVHRWRGEHPKSRARAEEAIKLLKVGSRDWVVAQVYLAGASLFLGDTAPALSIAATLSLAIEAGDRAGHVIEGASRVAGFLVIRHLSSEALTKLFSRFRKLIPTTNDDRTVALMQVALSAEATTRGEVEESLDLNTDAAVRFARAGDARNACQARLVAGWGLLELGQYERATDILKECIALGDKLGLSGIVAIGKHNLGPCLFEIGDVEAAVRMESEAVAFYSAQGELRLDGGSRYYLARMLTRLGRLDQAEVELRKAIERLASIPATRVLAEAALARLLVLRGRTDDALKLARVAVHPPEEGVEAESPNAVRLALIEALLANGFRDEARTVVTEAIADVFAHIERVRTPAYRKSALERVFDNARILSVARELGVGVPS